METFISKVTDYILEHYQHDFKQLTIVFPNRRAGIYLKKELASKAGKTIWLPKILSIEEAFVEWSGIDLADPLSIVFELLEIYLNNNPDKANDLNIFIGYAQQMAREFDEIDHYLVDTDILFNYLSEAKAIELWHADGSPLTVYEQNYLAFFKSLNSFYKSLKHRLNSKKIGYQGSIAAHLAGLKNDDLLSILGNTIVIFAGFNALTPAEEKVISSLANEGKATILWDLDSYYINENKFGWHEAGSSIRKFGKNHPKLLKNWIDTNLLEDEKKIHLIGVPGNIGQAKAAGHYLQMTATQSSTLSGTAVVLADEKLLSPVLNSIPDEVGKFNVTMGLPFIYSPVYQFIISLFELKLQRFQKNEGTLVPLKPLIGLLQHELISQFVS
ncbi:MAG: hypothetical protein Q8T08_18815, partial [Ignavibacteria bacterium]|nr:hypothetical protein [Ignavibacteria bacterium]